ncbi:MAG: hypothetical protein AAGF12_13085 [Myxococcota bacterium]
MRARWIVLGVVLLGVALLGVERLVSESQAFDRRAPIPPGGGPIDPGREPASFRNCARCHAEIAAEWEDSLHHHSFSNPVFHAEYARNELNFCRECHAPRFVSSPAGGEQGVDCATCHLREGRILGRFGRGEASHPIERVPELGTSAFCAPCHQFDFPSAAHAPDLSYHPDRPLQNTLREWQRSPSARAGDTCQSCHMPRRIGRDGTYRAHDFRGRELAPDALSVRVLARRENGRTSVRVRIVPEHLGHAAPTGDMFRQIRLELRGGREERVHRLQRWFGPELAEFEGEERFLLAEVDDTRVRAGRVLTLRSELPATEEVAYRLIHYRTDPDVAAERGIPAEVNALVLVEGRTQVRGQ